MSKKQSHPAYEALVDSLREEHGALTTGSLFGMPCVKHGGKAVLGAYDGGVVFKLGGDAHAEALALPGAVLFDPSGNGRPMKAWVVLGPDHEREWPRFAAAALQVS
ncbi:MAG: hypothetical protein KTR31_36225 [Myxococcales bacterium]|nr:hypothetical protein [Myxococcales bacterium]